jgi:hypothetical protein
MISDCQKQTVMNRLKMCLRRNGGYLRHSLHSYERCFSEQSRGFNNLDIVSLITNGRIKKVGMGFNYHLNRFAPTYTIHGKDSNNNWAMLVVSDEIQGFSVVTIAPATNRKLFGAQVAF